jgi:hypothetical protein
LQQLNYQLRNLQHGHTTTIDKQKCSTRFECLTK